jgi:glycosyltransferase involved in cell wall biosynthesis
LTTEIIGNLTDRETLLFKIKNILYTKILSKQYLRNREPEVLIDYAKQVERCLTSIRYDIVFSPGTIPISHLQTEKPIVFWTDSTFAGMVDFYPDFSNLCAQSIRDGNRMEQLALSKCRLAIYSSEWAANTAIQNYDVDPTKVKVVPFGANVDCNRNLQDIDSIVDIKNFDTCRLLFVGVDWHRKGGDFALAVADRLNRQGIRTELHIVGCNPKISLPSFVKLHGFISKRTEEGRRYLDELMSISHFLILPSRVECYGVVFAEASSFGLPALATKVGGIPTAIQDGKNGQTFPLDASAEKYCNYIARYMSSQQDYKELALSSFKAYSERLNWRSAGKQIYNLMQEFCF